MRSGCPSALEACRRLNDIDILEATEALILSKHPLQKVLTWRGREDRVESRRF